MKLILAIVNNEDSAIAASALTKEGFLVTKLSTTGGFLMVGNTTFLIGTEEESEDRVISILSECCATRAQTTPALGRSVHDGSLPEKVTVGGATVFVLGVDRFAKL